MLLLLLGCTTEEPVAAPPDVLIVILDTVRRDRISAYGHGRKTTPQLDAVSEVGLTFTRAIAPSPWTYPSHATLFSGLEPWEHGGGSGGVDKSGRLAAPAEGVPWLAEKMRSAGYATRLAYANGWLELGLDVGFEETFHGGDHEVLAWVESELIEPDDRPQLLVVNLLAAHAPYGAYPVPWLSDDVRAGQLPGWAAPLAMEHGAGINTNALVDGVRFDERVNTGQTHLDPEQIGLIGSLYDAGVTAADRGLNRVLTAWNAAGHGDGIVVITSDHGEFLGEEGLLDHSFSTRPPVIDVPLVVAWPGSIEVGRSDAPAGLAQVAPTLLRLTGIDPEAPGGLPGLGGAVEPQIAYSAETLDPSGIQHHYSQPMWRVRSRDRLLEQGGFGTRLYDAETDPGLTRDLAHVEPETVARLEALLPDAPPVEGRSIELDAQKRAQLEALGYMDGAP